MRSLNTALNPLKGSFLPIISERGRILYSFNDYDLLEAFLYVINPARANA